MTQVHSDTTIIRGTLFHNEDHTYLSFHIRSFNDSMNSLTDGKKPWTTKLSSAGLVYLHYGQRVLDIILGIIRASL